MSENKPLILLEGSYTLADLTSLRNSNRIWHEKDIYEQQLQELFNILYPEMRQQSDFNKHREEFVKKRLDSPQLVGNWVYFPWNGYLLHMLGEEEYTALRTNRNRNLITQEEQQRLLDFTVAIAGLSVGGGIAVGLACSGISKVMKLTEFDTLDTTNLNRLRAGAHNIGDPKISITAQQVYELNPYAELHLLPQALKADDLQEFFGNDPKPQVIFDEIDDFEIKIRLRLAAKEAGVPLIMLTSLGDDLLIDVERYDQDPNLEIFNGFLGKLPEEILTQPLSEPAKIKYAMQTVGIDNIPTRALASLLEINRTLVGRPQLASTVNLGSAFASYLVRQLAFGQPLASGRTLISLNKIFKLTSLPETADRNSILEKLAVLIKPAQIL